MDFIQQYWPVGIAILGIVYFAVFAWFDMAARNDDEELDAEIERLLAQGQRPGGHDD